MNKQNAPVWYILPRKRKRERQIFSNEERTTHEIPPSVGIKVKVGESFKFF